MVGSHRTRLAVLGAICLAATLAMSVPAAAADDDVRTRPEPPTAVPEVYPPGSAEVWLPARCATGAITGVREELTEPSGLWVSGWIQPCGPGLFDGFAVFWYYGPVAMRSRQVYDYFSFDEPTPFSVRIATPGGPEPTLGLTALCVAYHYDGRLACLAIDADTPGVLPAVTPIPPDDPRVQYPVPVTKPSDVRTDPVCGTCL
ncbi:hypothetical protein RB614_40050 [Phytohabitans sp. ZYX-F-186]|uniref:Uncharacterized protein n=1 Tax=Phytohabitans maris TaxID=3071409 RepID=A0ABU0ZUJ2_9ACTN|nr:hypothetical protein [Phytohabitans sp. ZYX-F-186]MDQ7910708.1 hypothetical protein [Phytohabitans sp. ZYX-F-186]